MTEDPWIAEHVSAALDDVGPSTHLGGRIRERVEVRRARRRAVRAAAAVAAGVAVIATGLILNSSSRDSGRSLVADQAAVDFRWEELPPAPIPGRRDSSAVWTGTEAVVWGGTTTSSSRSGLRADGAAYNPETRSWRMLPAPPIGPRGGHAAVWTGTEMIVWGGWRPESRGNDPTLHTEGLLVEPADPHEPAGWADGAAYNPTTNSWRRIADAPLGTRIDIGATWTGSEMVVVGGVPAGGGGPTVLGAAYDPSLDRWRLLADLPLSGMTGARAAWTGREVLYWRPPGDVVINGTSHFEPRLFAYDPDADAWRAAAQPLPTVPVQWTDAAVAWTGSELVVVSRSTKKESRIEAVAYDPTADRWRHVGAADKGAMFVPDSHSLWTGDEVVTLGYSGYSVTALRPRTGEWAGIPDGPGGLHGASFVADDRGDIYAFGWEANARLVRERQAAPPGE